MPGKHVNKAAIHLPQDIAAGRYQVEIGLMTESIPQLYLATDAERDGAYYVVGEVCIG